MPEERAPASPVSTDGIEKLSSANGDAPEVFSYVVKKGDTLSSISRRFSSSIERIQQSNPDVDPLRLVPGMILHIPKSSNGDA
jgi:LysM repeat protein